MESRWKCNRNKRSAGIGIGVPVSSTAKSIAWCMNDSRSGVHNAARSKGTTEADVRENYIPCTDRPIRVPVDGMDPLFRDISLFCSRLSGIPNRNRSI